MELLRVEHLSRYYGEGPAQVKALDDVSFSVEKGEFVAIMGPSGSGKSTLMHLLGGVDKPTAGHVWLQGTDLYKLDENALAIFRRRQIGLVYQFYNLLPVLKGLRVFYYRELYMLGVFHRKPWHPSPAVREEIRQLDKRIEQYEFLMNRDTRTLAQLRDLRAQTEAEVRKLNAERNRLYKTNPESDQIPLFTQRLRELRKTIKLCKRIEEHSLEIAQRQEEEQKRRAEQERRNAYERNTMETSAPIRP